MPGAAGATKLHIPKALSITLASILPLFPTNLTSRLRKPTPTTISIHCATAHTLHERAQYNYRMICERALWEATKGVGLAPGDGTYGCKMGCTVGLCSPPPSDRPVLVTRVTEPRV